MSQQLGRLLPDVTSGVERTVPGRCIAGGVDQAHADTASGKQTEVTYKINDCTAKRYVLDAFAAGVPKAEVYKWVVDLSRNFFVRDDDSFAYMWWELRDRWARRQKRRELLLPWKKRLRDEQRRLENCKAGGFSCEVTAAANSGGDFQRRTSKPRRNQPDGRTTKNTEIPTNPEQVATSGTSRVSARRGAVDITRPLSGPSQKKARQASRQAKQDVAAGACELYEQALATRLVLSFGTNAAKAFQFLLPDTFTAIGAMRINRKFLLLVHPDKSTHPLATQAFQRLAPMLRSGKKYPRKGAKLGKESQAASKSSKLEKNPRTKKKPKSKP